MENTKFYVNKMEIKLIGKPDVLTYNRGEVFAEFIFSKEWVGIKTALFKVGDKTYSILIDDNNICHIPEECYLSSENMFSVGCICGDLITTNFANVIFNDSCYTTNISIEKPSDDIYTQIINKINNLSVGGASVSYNDLNDKPKINGVELGTNNTSQELSILTLDDAQNLLDNYCTKNELNNVVGASSFKVYVDGGQNNWNANDKNTSFSVGTVNKWTNIPAKFSAYINANNKNIASYYGGVTEDLKGVQLVSDIIDKVNVIDFQAVIIMQNQVWYNTGIRLIAHAPSVRESEYTGDVFDFSDDTILIMQKDFTASNSHRNASISGYSLNTLIKNTATGEYVDRNDWILRFQMYTDNTQDYISDKSHVEIIFKH